MAFVSRMTAQDSCDWALVWTETHSLGYGLGEDLAQVCLNQPGPG